MLMINEGMVDDEGDEGLMVKEMVDEGRDESVEVKRWLRMGMRVRM